MAAAAQQARRTAAARRVRGRGARATRPRRTRIARRGRAAARRSARGSRAPSSSSSPASRCSPSGASRSASPSSRRACRPTPSYARSAASPPSTRTLQEDLAQLGLCAAHPAHRGVGAGPGRPHARRLPQAAARAGRQGRGDPLMAAPSTRRRRPARRRGGGPLRERERGPPASTAASASCASSSSSSSCSSAARPSRWRRRRSTSPGSPWNSRRTTVVLPAHRGAIVDRNGDELAVGKPQQTVYATPYLLDDPRGRGRRALRRPADQPPPRAPRRARTRSPTRRAGSPTWRARSTPSWPRRPLALDLPGVGSLRRGGARLPAQGHGRAGHRLRRHRQPGTRRHRAALRRGALRQDGQRDDRARPGGPHAQDRAADAAGARGRTCGSRSTPRSRYTPRTCSNDACASPARKSATAIVMDPRTGEVLAMANVARDGLPRLRQGARAAEQNRAVTDTYEPGSIFKLVTISGALADGLVTPGTKFTLPPTDPGGRPRDRRVAPARHGHATRSARSSQWSSNVGAVTIGMKMGEERLRSGWARSASASRPGSTSPARPRHRPCRSSEWSGSSIGNMPIGQGIAVTPHADGRRAFSAIANNGWAMQAAGSSRRSARRGQRRASTSTGSSLGKVAHEVRTMLSVAVARGHRPARPRSRATRSPARPAPPRSRSTTAAGTPRASTSPRSSAWCRRTTRGWSCSVIVNGTRHATAARPRRRRPARSHRFALPHLRDRAVTRRRSEYESAAMKLSELVKGSPEPPCAATRPPAMTGPRLPHA